MRNNLHSNLSNQNGGVSSSPPYSKSEISQLSGETVPESWTPVINNNLNKETIPKIQKGKPGYSVSARDSNSNYKNTKTAWFLFGNNGEPTQDLLNSYSLDDILVTYILANATIELLLNGADLDETKIKYKPYAYDILSKNEWNNWDSLLYYYRLTMFNNLIYNDSKVITGPSTSPSPTPSDSSFVLPDETINTEEEPPGSYYYKQCNENDKKFLCGKNTILVTSDKYEVERNPRGWCRRTEHDCNAIRPENRSGDNRKPYGNWETDPSNVPSSQRKIFEESLKRAGKPSSETENPSTLAHPQSLRKPVAFVIGGGGFEENSKLPEEYIKLIKTTFNGKDLKDLSALNASEGNKEPSFENTFEYLKTSKLLEKCKQSKIGELISQITDLQGDKKNLLQFEQVINIIILYLRISILCVIKAKTPELNLEIAKDQALPPKPELINPEDAEPLSIGETLTPETIAKKLIANRTLQKDLPFNKNIDLYLPDNVRSYFYETYTVQAKNSGKNFKSFMDVLIRRINAILNKIQLFRLEKCFNYDPSANLITKSKEDQKKSCVEVGPDGKSIVSSMFHYNPSYRLSVENEKTFLNTLNGVLDKKSKTVENVNSLEGGKMFWQPRTISIDAEYSNFKGEELLKYFEDYNFINPNEIESSWKDIGLKGINDILIQYYNLKQQIIRIILGYIIGWEDKFLNKYYGVYAVATFNFNANNKMTPIQKELWFTSKNPNMNNILGEYFDQQVLNLLSVLTVKVPGKMNKILLTDKLLDYRLYILYLTNLTKAMNKQYNIENQLEPNQESCQLRSMEKINEDFNGNIQDSIKETPPQDTLAWWRAIECPTQIKDIVHQRDDECKREMEKLVEEGTLEKNKRKVQILEKKLEKYLDLAYELIKPVGGADPNPSTIEPQRQLTQAYKISKPTEQQLGDKSKNVMTIISDNEKDLAETERHLSTINLSNIIPEKDDKFLDEESRKKCQAAIILENIDEIKTELTAIFNKFTELKSRNIDELLSTANARSGALKEISGNKTCDQILEEIKTIQHLPELEDRLSKYLELADKLLDEQKKTQKGGTLKTEDLTLDSLLTDDSRNKLDSTNKQICQAITLVKIIKSILQHFARFKTYNSERLKSLEARASKTVESLNTFINGRPCPANLPPVQFQWGLTPSSNPPDDVRVEVSPESTALVSQGSSLTVGMNPFIVPTLGDEPWSPQHVSQYNKNKQCPISLESVNAAIDNITQQCREGLNDEGKKKAINFVQLLLRNADDKILKNTFKCTDQQVEEIQKKLNEIIQICDKGKNSGKSLSEPSAPKLIQQKTATEKEQSDAASKVAAATAIAKAVRGVQAKKQLKEINEPARQMEERLLEKEKTFIRNCLQGLGLSQEKLRELERVLNQNNKLLLASLLDKEFIEEALKGKIQDNLLNIYLGCIKEMKNKNNSSKGGRLVIDQKVLDAIKEQSERDKLIKLIRELILGQSSSSASASSSATASSSAAGSSSATASSPISKDINLESICNKLPGKKTAPKKIKKACNADKRCSYNKTNKKCEAGESTGEPSGDSKKYTLKKKKHR